MALGSATHLWLLGTPSVETLHAWVLEAVPAATESDVVALRLGQRTLLAAVNTSDRAWWSRSVDVVSGVQPHGMESIFIGLYPDSGEWEVTDRHGARVETEARAKDVVRSVVPLELTELHHYVEWAQEVEELDSGAVVPELRDVRVEVLTLGLPSLDSARDERGPSARDERAPSARDERGARDEPVAPPGPIDVAVRAFSWLVLVPYLALGLAGPVFAWWQLLPGLLVPLEGAGVGMVLLMETAFVLPFILVWRRFPRWARALVVGVHVLAFAAGILRALTTGEGP
mgnify:CR=1 FL=1